MAATSEVSKASSQPRLPSVRGGMRNRLVITSATSAQSFRLSREKPRKLKAVFQISSGKLHEADTPNRRCQNTGHNSRGPRQQNRGMASEQRVSANEQEPR